MFKKTNAYNDTGVNQNTTKEAVQLYIERNESQGLKIQEFDPNDDQSSLRNFEVPRRAMSDTRSP